MIIFIGLYKAREQCERMTEGRQRSDGALCLKENERINIAERKRSQDATQLSLVLSFKDT